MVGSLLGLMGKRPLRSRLRSDNSGTCPHGLVLCVAVSCLLMIIGRKPKNIDRTRTLAFYYLFVLWCQLTRWQFSPTRPPYLVMRPDLRIIKAGQDLKKLWKICCDLDKPSSQSMFLYNNVSMSEAEPSALTRAGKNQKNMLTLRVLSTVKKPE